MAKIWCDKCSGSGKLYSGVSPLNGVLDGYISVNTTQCENCNGTGYTEADVVEVEKVRKMWECAMYDAETDEDFHKYFLGMLDSLKEAK